MKNKKMYNLFLISLVFLVYFLVSLGLYVFQRNLLYHPLENNYSGDTLNVNIEKVKITTRLTPAVFIKFLKILLLIDLILLIVIIISYT